MSKLIFSDMDGTLTNNEMLSPLFFDILNLIKKNNYELVIVTGRSLSWGHFLVTHFPINFVIVEGGGVLVYKKNNKIEEYLFVSDDQPLRLAELEKKLSQEHSDIPLSKDSFGRKTDRAIEYHEMNDEQDKRVVKFLQENNALFSRSSVHINYWFDEISKYKATIKFLEVFFPHENIEKSIYFGDSTNDESMFQYFPFSVGVSNISKVIDKLIYRPTMVLEGQNNEGVKGVYNYLKNNFFKA